MKSQASSSNKSGGKRKRNRKRKASSASESPRLRASSPNVVVIGHMEEVQAPDSWQDDTTEATPLSDQIPLVVDDSPGSDLDNESPGDLAHQINWTGTDRDTINSTRSLYDSDVEYATENGRKYCKDYYMPCDEDEQDRLQLQHQGYLRLCEGALTTVPLDNPTKILDVGTGKGDWAIDMGEIYPDAEVIGTDIAKVQPTAVPPNVFFEIDDAEDESGWTFTENDFDLIHFRSMTGAFSDWRNLYQEAYTHLKPSGWIEVLDFDDHKFLLRFFNKESEAHRLFDAVDEASRLSGRPITTRHLEPERLLEHGFVDVKISEIDVPYGAWSEIRHEQITGKIWLATSLYSIESLSLRLLTRYMNWDPEEVKRMCRSVVEEVIVLGQDRERMTGALAKLKILVGRKPGKQDEDPNSELKG